MSERNKHLINKIIDAISTENGKLYLNHLADDIKWNIVGMPVIKGKKEVLETIKELKLENFSSDKIKNIVAEGEFVVVESSGKTASNYFCDIYQLKNEKIQELTSYIVDTSSIESAGDIKREIFNK
jgi:limonene-1,2-epoxide hydrolase